MISDHLILPDELEQEVASFLTEKFAVTNREVREYFIENPKRNLFSLCTNLLSWKNFDLMEKLFAFEPNIVQAHQKIDLEDLLLNVIYGQNLDAFRWLLEHGAEVNKQYGENRESIWMRIDFNNPYFDEMMALLFKYGGEKSLTLKSEQGFDAFSHAIFVYGHFIRERVSPDFDHFETLVKNKLIPFFECCKTHLPPYTFPTNLMNDAAEAQSYELIQWLMKEGGDLHEITSGGDNIIISQMYGLNDFIDDKTPFNLNLFRFFIEQGIDVNFQNSNHGNTALHVAAQFGNIDACLALLEAGAQLSLNHDGRSALDTANEEGHLGLGAMLEQKMLQAKLKQSEPMKAKTRL